MSLIVKAHLQRTDGSVEMRRVPVTSNNQQGIFEEIVGKVGSTFPALANKQFTLRWKDSDGDLVTMSTDEEMLEAISQAQNSLLKLFITVDDSRKVTFEDCLEMESDKDEVNEENNSQKKTQENKKDHAKVPEWPFMDFMRPPFPGPFPPPDVGFHSPQGMPFDKPMEFYTRTGASRKRCHPYHFQFKSHHGHPFDDAGFFGPRRHHFSHHGPFGISERFGCHNMFGQQSPFPFMDVHFGHHFEHGKKRHEKHGWRAHLRDAVPVQHRRWAKAFVRNWRVQNLKNATSTSSESDQDNVLNETSDIPEAYARWLELALLKWHKSSALGQDASKNAGNLSEEKEKLKASVPVEFRKWTKWYLVRHFGKKESPKFRKHGGCHKVGGKWNKHGMKDWKKGCKMQTLNTSIPMMHRMWAKIFIKDWRQEHSLPDPKPTTQGIVSSESEDTEREGPKGDITVPNDYIRWMQTFLARWHFWRGEVEKVEIKKGGMAEFMDTVPKNFRKWVKCYLWQRYGNGVNKESDTASQYQKWLQAFQKQWLMKQQKGEKCYDLSSDEETDNQTSNTDDAEKTAESLKRLRLECDDEGIKKNASPSMEEVREGKKAKKMEIGDFESTLFHKKMTPGFRQWAKEALGQWDGKNAEQNDETLGSDRIPPHVYKWMSKCMMKMQMKRMKEELKQFKHSMKAAKKAHK